MPFRSVPLVPVLLAPAVLGSPAAAVSRVVADIAPVHSLVARVMEGVGAPILILPPGVTPHGHSMRPSEAAAIASADVVFWTGEALTPWFGTAIDSLVSPEAVVVELLSILPPDAEVAAGEHDDHANGDGDGDGDATDHDEEAHHDDGDVHAWLDPEAAGIWLGAIPVALSAADPLNAIVYEANADAARAEVEAMTQRIVARLEPVRGRGFIVFHDAYGPFERRFGLPAAGAISLGDAAAPSAARIGELRAQVVAAQAECVFSEPQFDPALVATLTEGTDARTGVLDPLGAMLEPGPGLSPMLLDNLAESLVGCLGR